MSHIEQLADDIHRDGYSVIDHFLTETHYDQLRQLAQITNNFGQFKSARIGRHVDTIRNEDIRKDKILWLEDSVPHEARESFLKTINQIATRLNRSLFLGIRGLETHFAIYQPGDFYRKHVDQFSSNKDRVISYVYYLNHNWQPEYGGELKLYNLKQQMIKKVLPIGNRLICFTSDLPHEVCETQKTRYSIAGWLKTTNPSIEIKQTTLTDV